MGDSVATARLSFGSANSASYLYPLFNQTAPWPKIPVMTRFGLVMAKPWLKARLGKIFTTMFLDDL